MIYGLSVTFVTLKIEKYKIKLRIDIMRLDLKSD